MSTKKRKRQMGSPDTYIVLRSYAYTPDKYGSYER